MPFLARDGVEAPVDAVDEIHVRNARGTVEVPRTLRKSRYRVAGRIIRTKVGLGFDNPARGRPQWCGAFEHRTEQVARDLLGGAIVKRHRKRGLSAQQSSLDRCDGLLL